MVSNRIAALFSGWEEALIWSCLHGCMGYAVADDERNPSAAQIVVGDFCFFAGRANAALVRQAAAPILVPQNAAWEAAIEAVWPHRAERGLRYAIKKEPGIFDVCRLAAYAKSKEDAYRVGLIDRAVYEQAMREAWSRDLCAQFADFQDYDGRGLGVAALYRGKLVAGASSYVVYCGGIEIEIDTRPGFRRKGLATACGARLILECLNRGLYPSWDAHDLRSVALAEKLGYHLDKPYTVYFLPRQP